MSKKKQKKDAWRAKVVRKHGEWADDPDEFYAHLQRRVDGHWATLWGVVGCLTAAEAMTYMYKKMYEILDSEVGQEPEQQYVKMDPLVR